MAACCARVLWGSAAATSLNVSPTNGAAAAAARAGSLFDGLPTAADFAGWGASTITMLPHLGQDRIWPMAASLRTFSRTSFEAHYRFGDGGFRCVRSVE